MKSPKLNKLFNLILSRGYFIKGPQKVDDVLVIKDLNTAGQADYSGAIPYDSYKKLFLPNEIELYKYNKGKIAVDNSQYPRQAIWGINILDLKAVGLFDIVLSEDIAYQKSRKNTLIIGFSPSAPAEYEDYKTFVFDFEENILEHLRFDVFIVQDSKKNLNFFAGSHQGMDLLENSGIKKYEFVQFVGFLPEEGLDNKVLANQEAMEKLYNSKIWDELGEICLNCGKCSVHCPTCFCYDLEYDNTGAENIRKRVEGSCFFDEFSQIAGGHNFLPTAKERIRFWYMHKFLRIPFEYKYTGCVGCGRCFKVCPVGINIFKNLNRLQKELFKTKNKSK